MSKPLCLITGAGEGIGSAVARRFSKGGYRIALIARDSERLKRFENEIPEAHGYQCDVSELDNFKNTLEKVRADLGPIKIAVNNAVLGRPFATILEANPLIFEKQFRVNVAALMVLTQVLAPDMIEIGGGAILVTGNTAAWRGKAGFSMFAPTKAAQRILTESIARDLGPKGIHVSYITVDAAIDTPWTRPHIHPDKPDSFFSKPSAIADTMHHIAHQDRSAWTFNVDLRPDSEEW